MDGVAFRDVSSFCEIAIWSSRERFSIPSAARHPLHRDSFHAPYFLTFLRTKFEKFTPRIGTGGVEQRRDADGDGAHEIRR